MSKYSDINNGDLGVDVRTKLNTWLSFLVDPPIKEIDVDYNIVGSEYLLLVTTGALDVDINLLSVLNSSCNNVLKIKKVDSGAGAVNIIPDGVQKIDNKSSFSLTLQYEAITIYRTDSKWVIA